MKVSGLGITSQPYFGKKGRSKPKKGSKSTVTAREVNGINVTTTRDPAGMADGVVKAEKDGTSSFVTIQDGSERYNEERATDMAVSNVKKEEEKKKRGKK